MAVKRGLIWTSFSKEKSEQIAEEFETLSFWKKPHNIIGLFYIAISVLSLGLWVTSWSVLRSSGLDGEAEILSFLWFDLFFGVIIYVFLAIFIFRNHRWAMILACLLYLADKVLAVIFDGFSLSPLVIAFVCILLTSRAVLVTNALKRKKTADVSTFG